jgi:hypothetical protein
MPDQPKVHNLADPAWWTDPPLGESAPLKLTREDVRGVNDYLRRLQAQHPTLKFLAPVPDLIVPRKP